MDEDAVTALEVAIADAGALVVQAEKYVEALAEADRLGARIRTLGADARRLNRHGRLDGSVAARLAIDAREAIDELQRSIAGARDSDTYRAASVAYELGDANGLVSLLPRVFTGIRPLDRFVEGYASVAWTRRGRARTPESLADEVAELLAEGLPSEGDDLSPGADAALQAVLLGPSPPEEEPIVLQVTSGTVLAPVFEHTDTGTLLVYTRRLRVPFVAHLADTIELDAAPADYPAYRRRLAEELNARRVRVAE